MSEANVDANDSKAKAFRCPNCSADMRYDAGEQKLACDHCGHVKAIAQQEGQQNIVEYNLEGGLAQSAERGLGAETKSSRCQECGATVSFTEAETAKSCDFCGSSQILEQQSNRNLIRPESVVPFKVDRQAASKSFTGWLSKLWFRPSDLKVKAKVTEIGGVYIPYWTFDADVHSDWTAEAGYYYYVTETDDEGDEHEVRHTRWEQAWGDRRDNFDDVLVCASKGLPENLSKKLSTFNTKELQPYDPGFLAGWRAEEYAVDLNEGWKQAVSQMESKQHSRCAGDVDGDTHRFLNVANTFSNETFKHVLLPIWISAYRYKEKVYRFLVNGQTGEVAGKAPWSAIKITLFVLALIGLGAGIALLVAYFKR